MIRASNSTQQFQTPGCLPSGFDLDSMLTREQFCIWQQVTASWFKAHKAHLRGIVNNGRKNVRVHPRTFLQMNIQRAA